MKTRSTIALASIAQPHEKVTRATMSIVVQKTRTLRIPLQTNVTMASRTQAYQHLPYISVEFIANSMNLA